MESRDLSASWRLTLEPRGKGPDLRPRLIAMGAIRPRSETVAKGARQ
jgi:hypothetical protein